MECDGPSLVRRYYAALDGHDYDDLEAVLASSFVQRRPDRSFEGRDAFVRFMRDDRPMTDTTHAIDAIVADGERVAVQGRLLRSDDTPGFAFADHFRIVDGRIVSLDTYTR